ncbi:hypothetical protein N9M16_05125 [Candidatus Dependentiae bacterium]|nr:hypothetical protein [Candidatus Dependentiae bacterium]
MCRSDGGGRVRCVDRGCAMRRPVRSLTRDAAGWYRRRNERAPCVMGLASRSDLRGRRHFIVLVLFIETWPSPAARHNRVLAEVKKRSWVESSSKSPDGC